MPAPSMWDRRANRLAAAIKQRVNAGANGITPPGQLPPFTKRVTPDWLLKNWQHPKVQQWMAAQDPVKQLEIANMVGRHIQGLMPEPASPMAANPLGASPYRAGMNIS